MYSMSHKELLFTYYWYSANMNNERNVRIVEEKLLPPQDIVDM